MRKIGINLNAVKDVDAEDAARIISEVGFNATFTETKSMSEQVRIADILAKNGISYDTVHAPFKGINAMWNEGEDGERMFSLIRSCIDNCNAAGVPIAVVHLSSGVNAPRINDVGMARFTRLIEHAEKNNVIIAFENQRKLANIAWALETFEEHPNVGFCWDCGHEYCFSGGREYMPLFSSQLVALHLHDNFAEFNGDLHMLPFDGKIDFNKVADYIKSSGYGGTVMLESFKEASGRYEDVSPYDYFKKAAAAARRLAEMTDKSN